MAVKKRDAAKGLGVINKTSKHGNEVVCRKGRYFVFLLICVSQREGCGCASGLERFSGCSCTSVCYFSSFPTVVLLPAAHSRNVHFRSAWVFFKGLYFLHSTKRKRKFFYEWSLWKWTKQGAERCVCSISHQQIWSRLLWYNTCETQQRWWISLACCLVLKKKKKKMLVSSLTSFYLLDFDPLQLI